MGAFVRPQKASKKNPFASALVSKVTLTVATEATNTITVSGAMKTIKSQAVAARGLLKCWLSEDAAGAVPLRGSLMPNGGYAIGTNGTILKGSPGSNIVMVKGTVVIDAAPEKFKTTTTAYYRISGAQYTKAAATAIVFSSGHVVSSSKFGVILLQVNAAGTVSTKVPSATQAYNSAALALAALPEADAANVALGYIQIAAKAATWTANTDDMTNGSDLTTATFVDASEVGSYPHTFDVLSNAAGLFDIVFSETGVRNPFYLNVLTPDGVTTSDAITFA